MIHVGGIIITLDDLAQLFDLADASKDGKVLFEEFICLFLKGIKGRSSFQFEAQELLGKLWVKNRVAYEKMCISLSPGAIILAKIPYFFPHLFLISSSFFSAKQSKIFISSSFSDICLFLLPPSGGALLAKIFTLVFSFQNFNFSTASKSKITLVRLYFFVLEYPENKFRFLQVTLTLQSQ